MKELLKKYNEDPSSLSSDEVKSIQKFLNDNGYDISYTGKSGVSVSGESAIDGDLGGENSSTRKAISEYLGSQPNEDEEDSQEEPQEETTFDSALKSLQESKVEESTENSKIADAELKKSRGAANAYNIADTAVSLGKLGRSIQQIRQGGRELKELKGQRPNLTTYSTSPYLDKAIQDAQYKAGKGLSDRTMGTLSGQNLSAYQGGLNAAREASGGQAGVYGSQAQNLYNQSLDNARKVAMMDDEAIGIANDRLRGLINMEQQNAQFDQSRRDAWSAGQLQDHREELKNAQAIRNVGEVNLLNQLGTLPYKIGNRVRDYSGYNFNDTNNIDALIKKQRNRNLFKENLNMEKNRDVNLSGGGSYDGGVYDTDV